MHYNFTLYINHRIVTGQSCMNLINLVLHLIIYAYVQKPLSLDWNGSETQYFIHWAMMIHNQLDKHKQLKKLKSPIFDVVFSGV